MKASGLHRNTLSYLGILVMLTAAGLILLSLFLGFGLGKLNPYLGIVSYLVLPGVFGFGLLLLLYGMRRESLRRRRAGSDATPPYPRLDLNEPLQRRRFALVLVGGVVLVALLSFASYNAFLFTESVTFCGRVCHSVMQPEYTAYSYSPHARVSCVECHVGEGASWYVRSKLSGVRQVFATAFATYERPIPTPIDNLRPARETCEQCHWPEKFFGAQLVQNPHFRYDEGNTAEQVTFLIKTGGGARSGGMSTGIHWHMVIDNHVRFVPLDRAEQQIPLIFVERADGSKTVYRSLDLPAPDADTERARLQEMDCMDCHNRPTHIFEPPDVAVDRAMASGAIAPSLPWVKREAVRALLETYASRAAAAVAIRESLARFYAERYPEVARAQTRLIADAASAVVSIYERTTFPEMNVTPATYPMHIGHRNWPGCFRCHDGRHVTDDGRVLTRDCNGSCHTMPERGPLALLGVTASTKVGWHIWELKGRHEQILCSRCHGVDLPLRSGCAGCHGIDTTVPMMSNMGCDDCHLREQFVTPVADCASCHADRSGLHDVEAHTEAACTDCHAPHRWDARGRETCLACHGDKKDHHAGEGACSGCHEFE